MEIVYLLGFVLILIGSASSGYWLDDLAHPCVRKCKADREPMTCEYDWTVESYYSMSRACYQCPFNEFDCHRPHCIPMAGYARPVYSVNRRLPGPSIQVCENDVIKVHVHNRMQNEEGEAIHWHGLHMRGSQHMDGVPHITQCPINAGHDFTYEFTAKLPGTHWWHSHAGNHRADGVFGSFIVRQSPGADPNRKLYDRDDPSHVILINEWAKAMTSTIDLATFHGVTINPTDGILINGRGTNQIVTRPSDNTTATVDHHIVYVKSGLRYRFRVIGAAGNMCAFVISIDDHQLKVIAMDGAPVAPFDVDRIAVFSGERYDFVIAADQPPTNYWIRVAGELSCVEDQEVGILRYAGTPTGSKPDADRSTRAQGSLLNPYDGRITPGSTYVSDLTDAEEKQDDLSHVDVTHYLELNTVLRNGAKGLHHPVFYPYEADNGAFHSTPIVVINNISYVFPDVPLLTHWRDVKRASWCNEDSLRTSGKDCIHEACECIHRIDIKYNQVVELVFVNPNAVSAHPMHIHGYNLEIVGMDQMWNYFTIEDFKRLDAQGKIKRNLKNPPRKDSFMVPGAGYLIARFRANNPGWWLMHCHINSHLKLGMGMVFHVEGDVPPPPANMPVCTHP
ncbi:laccase-4-like [Strongylocentrotus purpuratus]|uniref:Laccase n=1 Tax=Strongylocentrotus purpuratus TaxID=7668 RepID=A0A7M7HR16_STRPU|nr:laccase-4-like [Strongylocentrotus purpuratus]